jgi:hypothetical protein
MSKFWSKKENTTGIYARHTFRKVSDTATATKVGQTTIAIKFEKATNGAEQIFVVTPTTVRMRPCN